jgi:hypothetical protein
MVECIHYRSGYKYQLKKTVTVSTKIRPDEEKVIGRFVKLGTDGLLEIVDGYAWDGPSGPTIDTKNFMRGSLVHDALYQLMREGELDKAKWRRAADEELVRICREDGMTRLRAWWVLKAVRWFADSAASPGGNDPVSTAPRGCSD